MSRGRIERNRRVLGGEQRQVLVLSVAEELATDHEGPNRRFFKKVSQAAKVPLREVEATILPISSDLPFRRVMAAS